MIRSFVYLLCLLVFVSASAPAVAQVTCQTDCNVRCPVRWIKAGPFKTKYRDPTCKLNCERDKPLSCAIGVPIPSSRGVLEEIRKISLQYCALRFEVINKAAMLTCPSMITHDEARFLDYLKDDLIKAGIVNANSFDGVQIKLCNLVGYGQAPDRGVVYLDQSYRDGSRAEAAATLAHEMRHQEQYRRLGTDEFKCAYTRDFVACGGCQDRKNTLERQAYEFEDSAAKALAQYYGQQGGSFYPKVMPSFAGAGGWNQSPQGSSSSQSGDGASLLGTWAALGFTTCTPKKTGYTYFFQDSDSIIWAVNECGYQSRVEWVNDYQIRALDWNGALATLQEDGQAVQWHVTQPMEWRRVRSSRDVRIGPDGNPDRSTCVTPSVRCIIPYTPTGSPCVCSGNVGQPRGQAIQGR